MDFPQSTIEEITESERQMVLTAKERFGRHFVNARERVRSSSRSASSPWIMIG